MDGSAWDEGINGLSFSALEAVEDIEPNPGEFLPAGHETKKLRRQRNPVKPHFLLARNGLQGITAVSSFLVNDNLTENLEILDFIVFDFPRDESLLQIIEDVKNIFKLW